VMASTHIDLGAVVRHGAWESAFAVRERALKALEEAKASGIENPLDAGVAIGSGIDAELPGALAALALVQADLPDLCGVSRVNLGGAGSVSITDLRNEPRCDRSWRRDGTVRQRSDGGMLSDRDAAAVGVA
jgi:isoleucyl-tRNA synthetase